MSEKESEGQRSWEGQRDRGRRERAQEEEKEGGLSVTLSCLSLWLRIGNLSRGCPLLLELSGLSLHFWWDDTPTLTISCVCVRVCVREVGRRSKCPN